MSAPSDPLDATARALDIERAHRSRGVPVRVLRAWRHNPRVAAIEVDADTPLQPHAWTGALLHRRLGDDPSHASPFRVDVLEVDADTRTLFVDLPPEEDLPEVGDAWLNPFDYLRAPWRLLHDASCTALREPLRRELDAARGAASPAPRGGDAALPEAWRHDRVLVWGPPGTGKTHTLTHAAAALLADPSERLLLLSTTHRATDEIALRLGTLLRGDPRVSGLRRLGGVTDPDAYLDRGLASLLPDADPEHLRAIAEAQRAVDAAPTSAARAEAARHLRALRAGTPTLSTRPDDPRDRCVICTLYAALSAVVHDDMIPRLTQGTPPFTTVILDEAGLVGRAQTAAIGLLASRRRVLVGDPRQLSPIASAARSMPPDVLTWLARSGLDHLDATPRPHVQRLLTQRRMHPQIRAAVSALSYDDHLLDAPDLAQRPFGPPARSHDRDPRAVWCVLDEHTRRSAELHSQRGKTGSRRRPLALRVLDRLITAEPHLRDADVLFVAPYRAQCALVRDWIHARDLQRWRASTVHAQQGAEADVVLFDTVHASSTTWPAHEWVRLVNVGASRARHQLILLASRAELDQAWLRPLRAHLRPRALLGDRDAPRWVSVDATSDDPQSLFAPNREPRADAPTDPAAAVPTAAEPAVQWPQGDRLGAQIDARRQLRPVLSHEQARLVHRDLHDAGPRLVRGVAGSGKTLVLAHWVVRALHGLGVRDVTVLYANKALLPLLQRVIDGAWTSLHPVPGPMPWHRVHLIHTGELLKDMLREASLPPPGHADDTNLYDYESQARRLLATPPRPRFAALFIDEAQDQGHDVLQLAIHLVQPSPEGHRPVLIFYDNAQNVYGRRTPRWTDLGLDLRGRSDVMRESFRSTRPNTELALDVLHRLRPLTDDPDLRELMRTDPPLLHADEQGWWHADFCVIDGQAPQVRVLPTREEELDLICRQVHAWITRDGVRPGDIRVLALKNTRDALTARLQRTLAGAAPVLTRTTEGYDAARDAVVITTPHSFKGYDAELVIVAGIDGYHTQGSPLPAPLYVALTRARTLLLATAVRTHGGPGEALVTAVEEAAGRWVAASEAPIQGMHRP